MYFMSKKGIVKTDTKAKYVHIIILPFCRIWDLTLYELKFRMYVVNGPDTRTCSNEETRN